MVLKPHTQQWSFLFHFHTFLGTGAPHGAAFLGKIWQAGND
jgi:hypothetical protein